MWKKLLFAFLMIAVAITIDLLEQTVAHFTGETFNLQLSQLLYSLSPIVIVVWYIFLLKGTAWQAVDHNFTAGLATTFIAVGLIVIYIITFPSANVFSPKLYRTIIAISSSRLALTTHAGAFLIAIGGLRFLKKA